MPTGKLTVNAECGGLTSYGTISRTGTNQEGAQPATTVAAGKAGLLTRSDADTGVITLTAGHGQTNGKYDIFWDGGSRYDMDGTVDVNALTLDGGAGDDLPAAAATAVVVCKPASLPMSFPYASLKMLMVHSDKRGRFTFLESDGSDAGSFDVAENEGRSWYDGSGETNPITADIATVSVSNGDSTAAATMKMGVLFS
jgi:hypothetical protein